MGMDANLLAIGPFHPDLADLLDYSAERYAQVPQGYLVSTTLFQCASSNASAELAELVGAAADRHETHFVNKNTIWWEALHAFGDEIGYDQHATTLATLLRHSFTVLFMPHD